MCRLTALKDLKWLDMGLSNDVIRMSLKNMLLGVGWDSLV